MSVEGGNMIDTDKLRQLLSDERLRERIDQDIDYRAHEIVVPITGVPFTPYEFNAIKKWKAELRLFADHLITILIEVNKEA